MWNGAPDGKKTKRLSKDEIKKQLLESMIIHKVVESKELNKEAEEIQDPQEAAKVIKQYENIIKMKKKGIISIAYYQGKVFKKLKKRDSQKHCYLYERLSMHSFSFEYVFILVCINF